MTKTSLIPPLTSARLHNVASLFLSGSIFFFLSRCSLQARIKAFPAARPCTHTQTHTRTRTRTLLRLRSLFSHSIVLVRLFNWKYAVRPREINKALCEYKVRSRRETQTVVVGRLCYNYCTSFLPNEFTVFPPLKCDRGRDFVALRKRKQDRL